MTVAHALDWMERMLWTAALVGAPAVLVLVLVGVTISVGQAATQINDSAIGFAPKALAMLVGLVVWGEGVCLHVRAFA
ncbi:MAG: flagellar biosynthetic protein FliQ, partial [Deltaproteobacteria bacterium]